MCGIAGIVDCGGRPVDISLLKSMTDSVAHRGPDGEGYVLISQNPLEAPIFVSEVSTPGMRKTPSRYSIGFGHRRLSILDTSLLGRQPMASEDEKVWITYNGEVYNSLELRSELMEAGWQFRSTTDTEVVLAAYQRWGVSCLHRLNGMFAFAIWDRVRQQLFCARDRMGMKPFYYRLSGGRFTFASEIKALLRDPECSVKPNASSVYDFLAYGLQDHSAETFFEGINQLRPGHYLWFDQGKLSVKSWWTVDEVMHNPHRHEEEYVREFRNLLEDAVRIHLRSDRAVGSCLSGGLDSSTIVCLAHAILHEGKASRTSWALSSGLHSFTACFEDPDCDERPYLRAAVAQAHSQSHEIYPKGRDLFDLLPKVVWHQDEPFSGASYLSQWAVMQAASEHGVKVLLDGQGGDELLCGYPGYWGSYLGELALSGQWGTAFRELRQLWAIGQPIHETVYANFAKTVLSTRVISQVRSILKGTHTWMSPDFAYRNKDRAHILGYPNNMESPLSAHIAAYLSTHSLPALLHHEDRSSMAFSIEARLPFLDARVVEFLMRIPHSYRMRNGVAKAILRDAMKGVLPEEIRNRMDKKGFATPQDRWLRTTLRSSVEDLLRSKGFQQMEYWDSKRLLSIYGKYCAGQFPRMGTTIWRCLTLAVWRSQFFGSQNVYT